MERTRAPLDPYLLCGCVLGGLLFGMITGIAINYAIPVTYTSRAVLASTESPGLETRLSPFRAELVAMKMDDKITAAAIREAVRLRTTKQGLEITATTGSRDGARDIAAHTARLVPSIRGEIHATSHPPARLPMSEPDRQLTKDWGILNDLLTHQARVSGFADFREIPSFAGQGSALASKLMKSDDFNRRFTRFSEITTQLGHLAPTGDIPRAKALVDPVTADQPDSARYAETLGDTCTYLGTLLGLVGGLIFGRRNLSPTHASPSISVPADVAPW